MGHIFISYSHENRAYVHKLRDALQKKGFQVWIDDRLDYGVEWPMVIQEQLDGCDALILVASESSYQSKWVQKEVTRAQRLGKPFFPLLLSGAPWLSIESTQYVDVTNGEMPPEKFYERLADVTPRSEHTGPEIEEVRAIADEGPVPGEAPFKGLQYFDVEDAALFYGREALTRDLLAHIQEHRFLAVVGASGSGKSSVVRAGLVAALGDDPNWRIYIVTPTAHPLEKLALNLTSDSESVRDTKTLREDMRADPECLRLYARRLLPEEGKARLLLLVDQFEELFTLCRDLDEREAFINNLMTAVSPEKEGPVSVVLTLRADFYHHCMDYQALRIALEKHQKTVGAMTEEELRQAIEAPAEDAGWNFEPGLVDLMLRDVSDEPGALPLLSHALLATWGRRRGRELTLAGYSGAGGVHGAIAKTAEQTYQSLSPDQRAIARNIFLRLTELGEGTQDTRRRASLDELVGHSQDKTSVDAVLKILADARLVTTGKEGAEVAHEALIREWPTLRLWLDEDRESLRIHRHLTESAQAWDTRGRDPDDLYRGTRLTQCADWAKNTQGVLSPLEKEFLDASQAALAKERRAARLRWAVGVFILLLSIGIGIFSSFVDKNYADDLRWQWTVWMAGKAPPSSEATFQDESGTLMVTIPSGDFMMGSDTGGSDEAPAYLVSIDEFSMDVYEITNRQYRACVEAGICEPPISSGSYSRTRYYEDRFYDDFPVIYVTWEAARTYCEEWREARLPSEAEWEYAARGGLEGMTYPWGDDAPVCAPGVFNGANFSTCSLDDTMKVGTFAPNGYGLYDMAGNVWEWVADWYNAYPGGDPGVSDYYGEQFRVLRGGSWNGNEYILRVSNRDWYFPDSGGYSYYGFRCAR